MLDHDGLIPSRGRGRLFSRGGRDNGWRRPQPIAHWCREELPPGIPSLEDLYAICGRDFELSLDVALTTERDQRFARHRWIRRCSVGRYQLPHNRGSRSLR